MLIDDITIRVRAGNGGKGSATFNKNLNQYGPVGGSGGEGGDVYIEGSSDLGLLNSFRFKKEFAGENGENGRGQFRDGANGKDLILKVPVGTVVHNLTAKTEQEVVTPGERIRIAKGGRGGRGNFHFRSSTNMSPTRADDGKPGESFSIRFELKLIADVGFIGLPNVGKSSLLNELTNAKSRVANYAFTTLEPNLGVYYELILADIPGLIEGASSGRGLGIKFLRHIERTGVLFHIISAESPDPYADYKVIRKEMERYNASLSRKKEHVFLSKSDMISPAEMKQKINMLKKGGIRAHTLSIHDFKAIEKIKGILGKIIEKKMKP
ncbi:MAG: GTPase ObgE [bacterium]|nr:GTPase ObgE [bacterium]